MRRLRKYSPTALAVAFAASGVLHFARPEPFTKIVPRFLPSPKLLVYLSGAAELLCAAGLIRRERWSAFASAALLTAVLPANVQMAADATRKHGAASWRSVAAWARVPLQLPLMWAALQARRAEGA
jgi:uncharacterized membrane protein